MEDKKKLFTLNDLIGGRLDRASAFIDIETLAKEGGAPIHQISALFPGLQEPIKPVAVAGPSNDLGTLAGLPPRPDPLVIRNEILGKIGPATPFYEAVPPAFEINKDVNRSNTHATDVLRNTRDQKRLLTIHRNWKEAFGFKGRNKEKFFESLANEAPFKSDGDMSDPALIKRNYEFMGVQGLIDREVNRTPLAALGDVLEAMKRTDKKILWIANAEFEAGHFNAQMALNAFELQKMISIEEENLQTQAASESNRIMVEGGQTVSVPPDRSRLNLLMELQNDIDNKQELYDKMAFTGRMAPNGRASYNIGDFLYVNHPEVLKARALAAMDGNWEPVLRSIENMDIDSLKGVVVLDPFDVIKGVTSRGSRVLKSMGKDLDLKAVNRGISLELLGHAMFDVQEKHFGLEDNVLTAKVLKTMFDTAETLRTIPETASLSSLNAKQVEAINLLQRLGRIKQLTANEYAQGAVDRLIKDEYAAEVEGREFKHTTRGNYRTEWTVKDIPMDEGELRPKRITVPVMKTDWVTNRSVESSLAAIRDIPGNEELDIQGLYNKRKAQISKIGGRREGPEVAKERYEAIKKINDEQSLRVRESIKVAKDSFKNISLDDIKDLPPTTPYISPTIPSPENEDGVIPSRWNSLKKHPRPQYGPVLPPDFPEEVPVSPTRPITTLMEQIDVKKTASWLNDVRKSHIGIAGLGIIAASAIYQVGKSLYDLENEAPLPDLDYDTFGLKETPLDNEYIPDGLSEDGLAASLRKETTDFGSPYRIEENQQDLPSFKTLAMRYVNNFQTSMGETPVFFEGMKVDQRIVDFQMFSLNTPMKKQAIEAMMNKETIHSLSQTYFMDNSQTDKVAAKSMLKQGITFNRELRSYNVKNKSQLEVEDADTIIMHGGPGGQAASFRLSGIDAPEIGHSGEAIGSLRFEQDQPYGTTAQKRLQEIVDSAESVQMVFDPKQDTYGRALGVLIADGVNVNQQLVKEGWVKALPFGDVKDELIDRQAVASAEDRAYEGGRGIWQSEFWRTEKQLSSQRYRMTNNMLTRLDKLASSNTLAAAFTVMDKRGEGETVPNMAFKSVKRKLELMGNKKKFFGGKSWKPNYYGNTFNIMPESTRYPTPSYGISHKLELGSQKSTYLASPTLIDSHVYSNSIYSYRKPQITKKFKSSSVQKEFHQMGQTVMTSRSQNANTMMGG